MEIQGSELLKFSLLSAKSLAGNSTYSDPLISREIFAAFVVATRADELMLTAQIFDHEARLRSFELAGEILATG